MNVIKYFILIFLGLNLLACSSEKKEAVDTSSVNVKMDIVRFEQKFYTAGPEGLSPLKKEFPYLFPGSNLDSIWISKMKDEDELFLYKASQEVFGDFSDQEAELLDLFKHIKYYFPKFTAPKVITVLSNVDYDNSIIYADSLMFISLDVYLGKDHEVYADYPKYIKQNFNPSHLVIDAAEQLEVPMIPPSSSNTYLSRIIQEGKMKYLTSTFLPEVEASEIMGYTADQWEWAVVSESNIWKYFIEEEMLYSNDPTLSDRFIMDAPFSKFYLEVDKDSPGRIGVWFGWQIVNSFMRHNDLSLQEMLVEDNEELFKKSKYKPRKK